MITQTDLTFLIGMAFSLVAGFLIGVERESRGKDAGISTHCSVIIGSMLFTFLSVRVDPTSLSRIAAGIVAGVGFLGAGLIIREGTTVKNLTTAASLWFAAAIGMAIGYEYYFVAAISVLVAVFIPRIPHINAQSPESKHHKNKNS